MPNPPFSATAEGLPKSPNPTHASLFLEVTPALRQRMEHAVEHLIWLLDTFDGDPELEDDRDDEPNLGFKNMPGFGAPYFDPGDDRELDTCDDEDVGDDEPDVDDEPSFGVSHYVGYGVFECDLELDTCDAEPSLAALETATQENGSQSYWAAGGSDDRELDTCDKERSFRDLP